MTDSSRELPDDYKKVNYNSLPVKYVYEVVGGKPVYRYDDNAIISSRCFTRSSGSIAYGNSTTVKIQSNEQLSIWTTLYKDDVIYSNYLYYKCVGNRKLKKNVVYKLADSEHIYLYETKEDAQAGDYIEDLTDKYIRLNFNLDMTETAASAVSIGTN